jgi:hypothetical protein
METRMTIPNAIEFLRQESSRLAEPIPIDDMPSMTFATSFSPDGVAPSEVNESCRDCPSDLREFWSVARFARLFEDKQYGQWGLEILCPRKAADFSRQCRAERDVDFLEGDLVIGRFLGDSDLLLIICDATSQDYGNVLVALPLDPRCEWYKAADSFAEFLDKYAKSGGKKFWCSGEGNGI